MTTPTPDSPRPPYAALLLAALGAGCLALGAAVLSGLGQDWHPLLAGSGAGLALIVSGIALGVSAAFPLVLRRLAAADQRPQ